MIPLPQPPFDYVSHPPYMASSEWDDDLFCVHTSDLFEAVGFIFEPYGSPAWDHPSQPDRRIVVDARGVVILGHLNMQRDVRHTMVATAEVFTTMEARGFNPERLLDIELRIRMEYPEGAT